MATGDSGSGILPDPTSSGGRGSGGRGRNGNVDADADRMDDAPGIHGDQAAMGQATPAASVPKEGSARSKKLAKKSSRTILADVLENTAIGTASSGTGNDGNESNVHQGNAGTQERFFSKNLRRKLDNHCIVHIL